MFRIYTEPTHNIYFDASRGAIDGAYALHKFGANFDIDQSTDPETIWTGGGLYPWSSLTSAETIYCISTSSSDTTTLTVEGLDGDYHPLTETVTLAGTSAVSTNSEFLRVFRMTYDASNVGTITARVTSGSGTVVAQIDPTYGQTLMAVYTVPAGHTAYILTGDATIDSKKDCRISMFVRQFGKPFRIAHMAETSGHYRYDFIAPLAIPEKSDIDIQVDNVSANDSSVTANFDLIVDKNG